MINFAAPVSIDVSVAFEGLSLAGFLAVPEPALGLVVFAHGSGSSRFSRRNRFVAETLNEAGIATLLFDLLRPEEDIIDQYTREFRFDINLLTHRLSGAIDWAGQKRATAALPVGLFGASTGAAAALNAAARGEKVVAVVSRGGRPDLAAEHLAQVKAPTLLIVGGEDDVVIELNRQAAAQLSVEHRLEIIPGATHLFEEAGKLEQVANLARDWFLHYFSEL